MKTILIRMQDDIKTKLIKASKEDSRSINSFVIQSIKEKIAKGRKCSQ